MSSTSSSCSSLSSSSSSFSSSSPVVLHIDPKQEYSLSGFSSPLSNSSSPPEMIFDIGAFEIKEQVSSDKLRRTSEEINVRVIHPPTHEEAVSQLLKEAEEATLKGHFRHLEECV